MAAPISFSKPVLKMKTKSVTTVSIKKYGKCDNQSAVANVPVEKTK
jgi:hypothetical protein